KLKIRERKRKQLPADHPYRAEKYDAVMENQLMSDDEDCYDDDGKLIPNMYKSIAPTWRSADMTNFLDTVDAQKDPSPTPQTRPCIKGEPRHMPLHLTAGPKGRVHRWMVDDAW
ncbi:hypothetical protein FA13DRAFT_1598369, partial [Coprinellus micaceus]